MNSKMEILDFSEKEIRDAHNYKKYENLYKEAKSKMDKGLPLSTTDLVFSCYPMLKIVISKYDFSIGRNISYDDLLSEGFTALSYAATKYDTNAGACFATYGYITLENAIHNFVNQHNGTIDIPKTYIDRIPKIKALADEGYCPEEIAEKLELKIWQVYESLSKPVTCGFVTNHNDDNNDSDADWLEKYNGEDAYSDYGAYEDNTINCIGKSKRKLRSLFYSIFGKKFTTFLLLKNEGFSVQNICNRLNLDAKKVPYMQVKALKEVKKYKGTPIWAELKEYYDALAA